MAKKTGWGLAALLAGAVLCADGEWADFTGTWDLDLPASRSKALDEIMKLQGLNWVERTVAGQTSVRHCIRQESNLVLRVDIRSSLQNRSEIQYLDGRETMSVNRRGEPIPTTTSWTNEGAKIVTTAPVKTGDGRSGQVLVSRWLGKDGKTMYLGTEYRLKGQPPLEAVRVFHKVE